MMNEAGIATFSIVPTLEPFDNAQDRRGNYKCV